MCRQLKRASTAVLDACYYILEHERERDGDLSIRLEEEEEKICCTSTLYFRWEKLGCSVVSIFTTLWNFIIELGAFIALRQKIPA